MNRFLNSFFVVLLALLIGATIGCYQRSVAEPYHSDAKEVLRIRGQLGVTTSDKVFTNEEEEEEEEDE